MPHRVRVVEIVQLTADTRAYRTTRPDGYAFEPGQATDLSIARPDLEQLKRPFTFSSLPDDEHLEFVIKLYPEHDSFTAALDSVGIDDELLVREVYGAITYRGPGVFIAGGSGITPFLSIFRHLRRHGGIEGNRLFFSNRTPADIILRDELREILGDACVFVTTREPGDGCWSGRIDEAFLREHVVDDVDRPFYLCGPNRMVTDIWRTLQAIGARPDTILFEH